MDINWSLLAAAGLAGAIAGIVNQVLADVNAGRRQRAQIKHEAEARVLDHQREIKRQMDERTHLAQLRAEAAHSEAAKWSVPLVGQSLYWVDCEREKYLGRDVPPILGQDSVPPSLSDSGQVLRGIFRLATEHPTPSVREHAKDLYSRMYLYYGPTKEGEERSYLSRPNSGTFDNFKEFLEWLLPYVHPQTTLGASRS